MPVRWIGLGVIVVALFVFYATFPWERLLDARLHKLQERRNPSPEYLGAFNGLTNERIRLDAIRTLAAFAITIGVILAIAG